MWSSVPPTSGHGTGGRGAGHDVWLNKEWLQLPYASFPGSSHLAGWVVPARQCGIVRDSVPSPPPPCVEERAYLLSDSSGIKKYIFKAL